MTPLETANRILVKHKNKIIGIYDNDTLNKQARIHAIVTVDFLISQSEGEKQREWYQVRNALSLMKL